MRGLELIRNTLMLLKTIAEKPEARATFLDGDKIVKEMLLLSPMSSKQLDSAIAEADKMLSMSQQAAHTLYRKLLADFTARFQEEAKLRSSRSTEEWQVAEVQAMFKLVNEERAKLFKLPVELSEVEKADRMAGGHVDYSTKFPLYCVELVLCTP